MRAGLAGGPAGLRLASTLSDSAAESLTRVGLCRAGTGPLQPQWRWGRDGHPYDLRVADGADLLIEVDGDSHRSRERFAADLDDGLEAVEGGQVLLRLGWAHVRWEQPRVVATVRRLVAQRRATAGARRRFLAAQGGRLALW